MPAVLLREYKFFIARLDEFMKTHKHEFVVIKGHDIFGFFDSYDKALRAGIAHFGATTPFYIEEVKEEEAVHFYHGTV